MCRALHCLHLNSYEKSYDFLDTICSGGSLEWPHLIDFVLVDLRMTGSISSLSMAGTLL
jgi:hypothetical protein